MKNEANIKIGDEDVDIQLTPKEFSTGSRGYYGQGKGTFDEKRYQISVIVDEIGSKEKSKKVKRVEKREEA